MLNPTDSPPTPPTSIQTPLYEAVVGGRNASYYTAYFRRADARGYAPISWHWPALFIAVPWLLYRRQYRWAFVCFGFPYFAAMLGLMLDQAVPGAGNYLFLTVVIGFQMGFIPLFANAIYYRWAKQQIAGAAARHPGQPHKQIELLRAHGGTTLVAPAIAAAALLIAASLVGQGA
jgi:hypothetical protein